MIKEKSFKCHQYKNYEEYLGMQRQHSNSMYRTSRKSYDPYYERVVEDFKNYNVKKILCVGARDESEVNYFRNKGIDAIGIDLFSKNQTIIKILDMHELGSNFSENEFDIIFSCHSLEHSVKPDKVLQDMKKISKYGVFIVLPLSGWTHAKDPVMFNFMEKAGEEGDIKVTIEDVQKDIENIVEDSTVINFKQLPLLPNKEDGFWFSVLWNKE